MHVLNLSVWTMLFLNLPGSSVSAWKLPFYADNDFLGNFLTTSSIEASDELVTATDEDKVGLVAEDDIADSSLPAGIILAST